MNRPKLCDYRYPASGGEVAIYFNYAYDLEKYCNMLEKSLDKACDILSGKNEYYECNVSTFVEDGLECDIEYSTDKWKEFLLNDE